ncbi:hypothetical protein FOMPIDRAFT_94660 [Fomitopsis schrenkii]|uniref:Uncharacterized protein n=1 Tax=Fomitopsis schrenkii TaxID=2126942 RepID=S8F3A4_FOMSC|nr:hypothetical protein FOMPIDRAFT_94660 [Fomitopsis schrenkii]
MRVDDVAHRVEIDEDLDPPMDVDDERDEPMDVDVEDTTMDVDVEDTTMDVDEEPETAMVVDEDMPMEAAGHPEKTASSRQREGERMWSPVFVYRKHVAERIRV